MPVLQTNPTSSQLMTSARATGLQTVNPRQQLALAVYAMAVRLKWDNGTNYVGDLTQLVKDAEVSTSGMSDADVMAALVGIECDQAQSDSSTDMPAAISDRLAKIRLFSVRDLSTLTRCLLLLEYLLLKRVG